jgi:GNAT superfamily N-acetyltransferase
MGAITILPGDNPQVEAFLEQRIYEYNAAATGHADAEAFTAARRNAAGAIEAATCGFTWGGCCWVAYLWVAEPLRGQGVGGEILAAIEDHARQKGCAIVLLASHTFQAPGFYMRKGYRPVARIEAYPAGHAAIYLTKELGR